MSDCLTIIRHCLGHSSQEAPYPQKIFQRFNFVRFCFPVIVRKRWDSLAPLPSKRPLSMLFLIASISKTDYKPINLVVNCDHGHERQAVIRKVDPQVVLATPSRVTWAAPEETGFTGKGGKGGELTSGQRLVGSVNSVGARPNKSNESRPLPGRSLEVSGNRHPDR